MNATTPTKSDLIIARGRLKDARRWFEHRGWDVLPDNERGQRILQWGADHAWMASPANPARGVRRWCRCWAPWLTEFELDKIVEHTKTSNKRWSHDQSGDHRVRQPNPRFPIPRRLR